MTIQFAVLLFWLSGCTTVSEGHRALHFQKSFKCDHFLFSFELVYHAAYFIQNTTLSCLQAIYESLVLKSDYYRCNSYVFSKLHFSTDS